MAKKHSKRSSPASEPVLVLDAGTTGVKALVFRGGDVLAQAYQPLHKTVRKRRGHRIVEEDPMEILRACRSVLRKAVRRSGVSPAALRGMGIVNQRETSIMWNKRTGRPLYPAIVWEDTRTAKIARKVEEKHGKTIRSRTGLAANSYFSAPKIAWLLEHVPGLRGKAGRGETCFGTVDSWLLSSLAEGRPHSTDRTNASRTLLFNVRTLRWDPELLKIWKIPAGILPAVRSTVAKFGRLRKDVVGAAVPIVAMCGDQESSLYAAGTAPGTTKVTYGTGAFLAQAIGGKFALRKGFFTTLAAFAGKPMYMLEAKVDDCGARIAPLIGNTPAMRKEVSRLAKEVAAYVKKLPLRPKRMIADGGVTQFGELAGIQAKAAGVPVVLQRPYNGTALGAARLVYKAALQDKG